MCILHLSDVLVVIWGNLTGDIISRHTSKQASEWVRVSIRGGWGVRKCMKSFMSLVHGLWRQDASFHWLWRCVVCLVQAWEYDLPPLSLYTQLQVVLLRRTHLAITKASCPTYVVYDVRPRVFIGCGALCYFLGFFRMPSLFIYLNWFIITFIIQLTYIFTYIKYFSPFLYLINLF